LRRGGGIGRRRERKGGVRRRRGRGRERGESELRQ
jgi:hypothetical protein